MLETYFKYPGVLHRMRRGPLAGLIDQIASDLEREETRRYLHMFRHLQFRPLAAAVPRA